MNCNYKSIIEKMAKMTKIGKNGKKCKKNGKNDEYGQSSLNHFYLLLQV